MEDVSYGYVELLAAPRIDTAIDSVAEIDGTQQLVVLVTPYEGMGGGDLVHLRWDTGVLRTSRIDTHLVDTAEVGQIMVFTVSRPVPGATRVSYVISRPSGEWRASERLDVTVRG
ncbi:hypothetical protein ACWFRJ_04240 [Streptomyces sp. NPDC055239]